MRQIVEDLRSRYRLVARLPRDENGKIIFHDWHDAANHYRYTVLYNQSTGKVCLVDGYKKRYDRMRTRIVNWGHEVEKIEGDKFYKMFHLTYDVKGTKIKPVSWKPNDIRDFEVSLRAYIARTRPGVIIYGYAMVGEVQPISKNYHYHLSIVTSKKLHFRPGEIERLWRRGFVKVTVQRSVGYLIAYSKKQNQKDYFYFPIGARGFSVWIAPWAFAAHGTWGAGEKLKVLLRYDSLMNWQIKYLHENARGEDLEQDLELISGLKPPPSDWVWKGSWVKLELAEKQVLELGGSLENRKEDLQRAKQVEVQFLDELPEW